jgi:hypothetical protein
MNGESTGDIGDTGGHKKDIKSEIHRRSKEKKK